MGIPLTLSDVPDATPYIQYIATNGQTSFPYPFAITQDSDLVVVVNGATLATDSGYALTGQGNDTGGNVVFTLGQTAGAIITLFRDIEIQRLSQIAQNSGFSSTVFNAEFNNIYLIMQQLEAGIAQCLQLPNTNNPTPITSLTPALYANKYLSFDANGNPLPAALVTGTITAPILGSFLYPPLASETGLTLNLIYPYGDMRRYGLVPNNSSTPVMTANTAALVALCSPLVAGPTGNFYFPNTTGADIYYFNGQTDVRTGMRLDLGGCTLTFQKALASSDNLRGFLNVVTDAQIYNGTINVNVTGTGFVNAGPAIRVGSRSGYPYGQWPGGIFDQDTLVANNLPMQGDIVLRNLYVTSNNSKTNCSSMILMTGGLRNCLFENLYFDGQSSVPSGFIYEFGFASTNGSGTQNLWTSSHACNMIFRNIYAKNLNTTVTEGYAIELGGSHHCIVENLVVDTAYGAFNYYLGEAMFWRPWTPVDAEGVKRGMVLRNIVGDNLVGVGINLGGSTNQFGGYLAGIAIPDASKLDLMSFEVSGCSINAVGASLQVTGSFDLRNSTFDGLAGSSHIIIGDDCRTFNIENVRAVNSSQYGIRGSLVSQAITPTVITAANASISAPFNGMVANEAVIFQGSMGAVTGIAAGTIYYVLASGLTSSAFKVSATVGGSAITPGGGGTAAPTVAPARLKIGTVSKCVLAGNGGFIGAIWSMCSSVLMYQCQIGYNVNYDGIAETVQTVGVDISYTSNGGTVICDGCFVSTSGPGTAYQTSGAPLFGIGNIRNPKNENTYTVGNWEINGVPQCTGAVIGNKLVYPNIFDKYLGKMAYNTTTNKLFVAQGATATSTWLSVDGVTTITPA